MCFDSLLGLGIWYSLVTFANYLQLPYGAEPSLYVACGVVAVILPASLLAQGKRSRKRESTMVCERCNALKTADERRACPCGGTYFVLPQMKWVTPDTRPWIKSRKTVLGRT